MNDEICNPEKMKIIIELFQEDELIKTIIQEGTEEWKQKLKEYATIMKTLSENPNTCIKTYDEKWIEKIEESITKAEELLKETLFKNENLDETEEHIRQFKKETGDTIHEIRTNYINAENGELIALIAKIQEIYKEKQDTINDLID